MDNTCVTAINYVKVSFRRIVCQNRNIWDPNEYFRRKCPGVDVNGRVKFY